MDSGFVSEEKGGQDDHPETPEQEKGGQDGMPAGEKAGQNNMPKAQAKTKNRTSDPSEVVKLALGEGPMQDLNPITVGQFFKKAVRAFPSVTAMKVQHAPGREWQSINFSEYYSSVIQAAKSFIKVSILLPLPHSS